LACELLHLLDYDFVVRGDAGIGTVQDETLHARDVIRVHVALFGKRNARRLLVRTLAYAHASTERIHVLDVRLCSIQIALEHYADSPAKFRIKTIFEQLQRLLCVVARFHVESDEAAVLARPFEYVAHYRDAQLFGNVQTHRRELHAHIRIELLARDAIENLQVFGAGSSRLGFVVNALAEQVERRCDSATVELPNRGNRGLERLASDEAGGEPLGQAICLDELENSRLVGKIEQCVSDHLTCISELLGTVCRLRSTCRRNSSRRVRHRTPAPKDKRRAGQSALLPVRPRIRRRERRVRMAYSTFRSHEFPGGPGTGAPP